MEKYIVAIEPGSSKIRAALASVDSNGAVSIKTIEEEKLADSVVHGVVRNVQQTAKSIRTVLDRLEFSQGGGRVTGVYVGLGGRSTMAKPLRTERRFAVDTEITDDHIRALEREALDTVLPERDVVAVTPRGFAVDNQSLNNPSGSIAREVCATYNVISCRQQLKRNLQHIFEKTLQLPVNGFVVRQLAEADMALSANERRIGCMLVDFGAETVTVSIHRGNALQHLATLPLGSRHITRDIASVTHLEENAERQKIGGNATGDNMGETGELVAARVGEIIANIMEQIKQAGFTTADLPGGIVVAGGGARLKGFNQRLEQVSKLSVRAAQPSQGVRLSDSSMGGTEAFDVIALAAAVAAGAESVKPCFEEYVETMAPAEAEAGQDAGLAPDEEEEEETPDPIPTLGGQRKQPRQHTHSEGPSWMKKMRDRLANLVTETDSDDDDEMRDDE